jgi:signal transduction histidine kinase
MTDVRAGAGGRGVARMAVRPRADIVVGLLLVVAVVVHAVSRDETLDDAVYLAVLLAASVSAWVGATRSPRRQRLVGGLIAGGLTLTAVGDVLWIALESMGRGTDVSIADPPWFLSYALIAAALFVVLRRSGAGRQDVDFSLDAATIVVVSVLVLWSLSIYEIVTDTDLEPLTRAVWAAYPIADAVLLALVLRVLTSRVARTSLDPSFAVGTVLWLAADVGYLDSPAGAVDELMDIAWMVAPALLARSVWLARSAPAAVPEPVVHRRQVRQLAIAFLPLFVPPALELANHLRGRAHTPYGLVAGATVLILLAFARAARLVRSEQRALRELEQARDDALEAYRAKSMFLATMSHEIRTPLTMVLGAGELLETTDLDDFQRDLVQRVRRSGTVLRSLVDVVLDYSRLEAGEIEVVSAPVDLRQLVDTLATTYGPCAESRGVDLECVLDPGLPPEVTGDPGRLVTVLGNLLDNAVKFTPAGRVRLAVRCAGEGAMVEYVVQDSGIGIPEDHLDSVFESFTQVDSSTTRSHGGIGLGLAICRRLTDSMGGTIGVTSRLDAGNTFVVRLPLVPVAHPAAHAP